jgi:PleD family two-component response regulator
MDQPFAYIIETERDLAAMFRHAFDMAGYRTEVALNGQKGKQRLAIIRPDLVLIDLDLPGPIGTETLKAIRNDSRLVNTVVAVVTSHSHVAENLPVKPDLVLLKPISADQITDLLKQFESTIQLYKAIPINSEPWDQVTELYDKNFFVNRLSFSLKHAEEDAGYSFGALGIRMDPTGNKVRQLKGDQWNKLLHETASVVKTTVRLTDTVAGFDQGKFYILLEDIPNGQVPRQVATRIRIKLNEYSQQHGTQGMFPLRIGVILGSNKYRNTDEVLRDVDITSADEFRAQ